MLHIYIYILNYNKYIVYYLGFHISINIHNYYDNTFGYSLNTAHFTFVI